MLVFSSLGFDSLDIVNFRNRIQATYNKSLPLTTFPKIRSKPYD
eukprot:UN10770